MSVEVLLIAMICAITLLAYTVAINAHGPLRLTFSYFIATMMLAGTVWLIIQHVNTKVEIKKNEVLMDKIDEQSVAAAYSPGDLDTIKKERPSQERISKIVSITEKAGNYCNLMLNVELQDKNIAFEDLVNRASDTKKKIDNLIYQVGKIDSLLIQFPESGPMLKDGLRYLSEASVNYKSFYIAEDSAQELQREKQMRTKAKGALEKLYKAELLLKSSR